MKNMKDKKDETKSEEIILEVTPQDYEEGLKRGWTDDDMLKPGRYKMKRSFHAFSNIKPIYTGLAALPEWSSLSESEQAERLIKAVEEDSLKHPNQPKADWREVAEDRKRLLAIKAIQLFKQEAA